MIETQADFRFGCNVGATDGAVQVSMSRRASALAEVDPRHARRRIAVLTIVVAFTGAILGKGWGQTRPVSRETVLENACGTLSLFLAARVCGCRVEGGDVFARLPPQAAGHSLAQLAAVARDLGIAAKIVKWDTGAIPEFPTPGIVHLGRGQYSGREHFIVVAGRYADYFLAIEPQGVAQWIPFERLSASWTGHVLYLGSNNHALDQVRTGSRIGAIATGRVATLVLTLAVAGVFVLLQMTSWHINIVRRQRMLSLGVGCILVGLTFQWIPFKNKRLLTCGWT